VGDLIGALLLHLLLLPSLLLYSAVAVELGAPQGSGSLDAITFGFWAFWGALWLALAAMLGRWWFRGRKQLWDVTLAWTLVAWLTIWIGPLLFWPRLRRWLSRSFSPWDPTAAPRHEPESVRRMAMLAVLPASVVWLFPLILAAVLADVPAYRWYDDHGLRFQYPGEFERTSLEQGHTEPATWTDGLALTNDDVILLEAFRQERPSRAEEMAQRLGWWSYPKVEGFSSDLSARSILVAGMWGVETTYPTTSISSTPVTHIRNVLISARTNTVFSITCQATETREQEVREACDLIVRTLTLTGLP
jgi:hypothetical protein